ncbi:XrtA-associated ATPase [Desulfovibrio mangrovi]|uniref:XrtA/PEP-CTERM system-associated ATPase n=1 Tax=Desulfovibrio mangrovi TaxID=2976983 RepID=UPI0022485E65|nr:XrtA/PEP-CTERM system-associated ATPase [Desulfovibrio mangrovi]UZP67598.1 XrtA-associated ATPase [Desulfovibrio mangrovi]
MYREFYGLTDKPFNIVPNPGLLYESHKHRQALTYLQYGFSENIGFILFTGEIGTGKTTLLKRLLNEVDARVDVAVVFNTNVSADELLRLILLEFEIEGAGLDKSRNLDLLNDHLVQVFSQGRRCLLVIDEAQNLSSDALEEVRLLSNLQTDTHPLLQIILAGQPELRDVIRSPGLEQLAQRVAINYHLDPLNRNEVGEYIRYRLAMAGVQDKELFTEQAIDRIHAHTRGIPRSINIMCNAALVYGYADSLAIVGEDVIGQIIADKIGVEVQPYVDSATSGRNGNGSHAEGESQRMAVIEARVAKLVSMVDWQAGQIDGVLRKGADTLLDSMRSMLDEERKRSERLLGKCVILYQENKALREQLGNGSGRNAGVANDASDEVLLNATSDHVDRKKKSFLDWLLG